MITNQILISFYLLENIKLHTLYCGWIYTYVFKWMKLKKWFLKRHTSLICHKHTLTEKSCIGTTGTLSPQSISNPSVSPPSPAQRPLQPLEFLLPDDSAQAHVSRTAAVSPRSSQRREFDSTSAWRTPGPKSVERTSRMVREQRCIFISLTLKLTKCSIWSQLHVLNPESEN